MHTNKGKEKSKLQLEWIILSNNNIKSDTVDVRNRFAALQVTGNDDNNADTTYNNIEAAKM